MQVTRTRRYLMKKIPNHLFALSALTLFLAVGFTAGTSQAIPPSPAANSTPPPPLAEELKPLQGHWEGEGAGGKCSITITGNTLLYRKSTDWFKTEFTLPAGTEPRQLHATIKECFPPADQSIGTVVHALFKLEDGTLTLATYGGPEKPSPEILDDPANRYVVKKVQPQKKPTEAAPAK